jgi:hypothetical protein
MSNTNIGSNSNPSIGALTEPDRAKIKKAMLEMNDSFTRMQAEKDLQKEIIDKVFEETGLSKKLFRKVSKTYYKASFAMEVEENNYFEEVYDTLNKTV